jgi:hypothetical protein
VSRLTRTLAVLPLVAAVSAALLVSPASADRGRWGHDRRPATLPLVTGSMPEGISAGPGTTFFAGARSDGAIYVGDVRRRVLRTLVPGQPGEEVAVGLLYDRATRRLWVAGGATGDIKAYDARTGRLLFRAETPGGFLNDVAVTRDAVYVTDSFAAQVFVVPLGRRGRLPDPQAVRAVPVTGDYAQPEGFGLNGIRVLRNGELIVAGAGKLYTVDPVTGVSDQVEVSGVTLTGGDGLVLQGRTLYVVRGRNPVNSVVELRLDRRAETARFVEEITDPTLDVPTTGALIAGDLYVVNGRFTTIDDEPDAAVSVTRLDL